MVGVGRKMLSLTIMKEIQEKLEQVKASLDQLGRFL